MAYTPTTWTTGDTITATAMNKIENGIADAGSGGGGVATVRLDAEGFNSNSKTFGHIMYALWDETFSRWLVTNDDSSTWYILHGYVRPDDIATNVLISSDPNIGVFLLDQMQADKAITGDISTTADTLYLSWGSVVVGNAYKITGNGSFTFIAE